MHPRRKLLPYWETSPLALASPGSMQAHDDLRHAFTMWELSEQAFDADPTSVLAAHAPGVRWARVAAHALNCGGPDDSPALLVWVRKRLAAYARSMGRPELADLLLATAISGGVS